MEINTLFCPRSDKEFETPEQKTLPEYLLHKANHFAKLGRSAYLIDGITDEARYFKDFDQETRSVASKFYKNGLRKGDVVVYMSSRQIHQLLLMAGVWRANGVTRSLYAEETAATILEKVRESKVRWIFCDYEAGEFVQQVVSKVEWPVEVLVAGSTSDKQIPTGGTPFQEYLNDDGMECPDLDVTENDFAFILPTSGTTGPSKGALHSHKSGLAIVKKLALLPWTTEKCNLIASKSTHISGLAIPLCMIDKGATGIVLPKVDKFICIRTVDKYKPGATFAFPTFLLALGTPDADGYDVSSVEIILTGGGTTTAAMKKAFLEIGNVREFLNIYGLTEASPICSTLNFSEDKQFLTYPDVPAASVGRPFLGMSIQIRDLQTLEPLGSNQRGEICLKGDIVFVRYSQNPESTKDAFVDGWLRTGDVGYYDERGYIYVVDRKKDIFKYMNNHISPTELEDIIFKHPCVQEVCVIGIKDEFGEVPRAFVTLKKGHGQALEKVTEDITKFTNDQLATYKHLRGGLFIIEDLPKGKTGKVDRKLVSEIPV